MAASLGIELLYLPTCSPNLKLIERLWKFIKKECLYSTCYDDFAAFKQSISSCLAQAQPRHKTALDTRLELRLQAFKESQLVRRQDLTYSLKE